MGDQRKHDPKCSRMWANPLFLLPYQPTNVAFIPCLPSVLEKQIRTEDHWSKPGDEHRQSPHQMPRLHGFAAVPLAPGCPDEQVRLDITKPFFQSPGSQLAGLASKVLYWPGPRKIPRGLTNCSAKVEPAFMTKHENEVQSQIGFLDIVRPVPQNAAVLCWIRCIPPLLRDSLRTVGSRSFKCFAQQNAPHPHQQCAVSCRRRVPPGSWCLVSEVHFAYPCLQHLTDKHGEQPQGLLKLVRQEAYPCAYCSKGFKTQEAAMAHIMCKHMDCPQAVQVRILPRSCFLLRHTLSGPQEG